MGIYDTYLSEDGQVAVQLKTGPVSMTVYRVGEAAVLEDGIYVGYEGVVLIRAGVVDRVQSTPAGLSDYKLPWFTKWGDPYDFDNTPALNEYNPISKAISELEARLSRG